MNRKNFPHRKALRREEAQVRAEARAKRGDAVQLLSLEADYNPEGKEATRLRKGLTR